MNETEIVKKTIADATKELIRKNTIDKITVDNICDQSGIKRRNFYRYFRDKYEVIEWINYNDFVKDTQLFTGWSIHDYIQRIAEIIYTDPEYYAHAFLHEGQNSLRNHLMKFFHKIIDKDYRIIFSSNELYEFYFEHACNIGFDLIELWLSKKPTPPPETYVSMYREVFYNSATVTAVLMERGKLERSEKLDNNSEEPSKK